MATLHDIIRRLPPVPWEEGGNLPWNDPAFSKRMLEEHLTQEHDLASRRAPLIDAHVGWIETLLDAGRPARILDLACGPGLYLSRLARHGHRGVGIDFSPAAIAHARTAADAEDLDLTYVEGDLRTTDFGEGFDLALLLYGQINVFTRDEAADLLHRARTALSPGGRIVLEPQRATAIEERGGGAPTWTAAASGVFSPRPHLLLTENFWNAATRTTTERFFVIDAADGTVTVHTLSSEAYRDEEWMDLLAAAGFVDVTIHPGLSGDPEPEPHQMVVVGRAPAG